MQCDICHKTVTNIQRHRRRVHKPKTLVLVCPICTAAFPPRHRCLFLKHLNATCQVKPSTTNLLAEYAQETAPYEDLPQCSVGACAFRGKDRDSVSSHETLCHHNPPPPLSPPETIPIPQLTFLDILEEIVNPPTS